VPFDADRLFRPTLVRPVSDDRYEIELADALGEKAVVRLSVRWETALNSWLGVDFDPPSMGPGEVRYDSRSLVKLAAAMHESIHHQFPPPGDAKRLQPKR
jgi:hypothetical protein